MIEFLSPVSKSVIAHREVLPVGVIGKQVKFHKVEGELPELENVKFAIFGIKENRRALNFIGMEPCFDGIRKSFYSLYPGNWSGNIVDLGDIEKGKTVEDKFFAV